MAITLSNIPSLLMTQFLCPSAYSALLKSSLSCLIITPLILILPFMNLTSIPLPPSPAPAVSFPQPLAHLGCSPSYLYKYPVINQEINFYLLLLFPPLTHFVYPCRLAITRSPLVGCSISLFKLFLIPSYKPPLLIFFPLSSSHSHPQEESFSQQLPIPTSVPLLSHPAASAGAGWTMLQLKNKLPKIHLAGFQ